MTRKSNIKPNLDKLFTVKLLSPKYKRRLLMHETPIPMFQDVLDKLIADKAKAKAELV